MGKGFTTAKRTTLLQLKLMHPAKRQQTAVRDDCELDLLAAVFTVCRSSHRLLALPHIPQRLMDFLLHADTAKVERANKAGLPQVVRWLLKRCDSLILSDAYRHLRFLRGITEAAFQGIIALLKVWLVYYPNSDSGFIKRVYEIAIRKGHVHLLEWLQTRNELVHDESTASMITSFQYSRPNVVHWLHSHFPKLVLSISMDNSVARSSREDSLAFLEWLWSRKKCFRIVSKALTQTIAAANGDMRMLIWLNNHRVRRCCMQTLEVAARHGHFEIVKWIYERIHSTSSIPASAEFVLKNGHFEIFHWLFERIDSFACKRPYERRLQWARDAVNEAAHRGELETLKMVYHVAYQRANPQMLYVVSYNGHVDILEWLLKTRKSFKLNNSMMDSAAGQGHLAMVQFLHGKGLRGTTNAMAFAASGGHLEVLKWLHEHENAGCTTRAMDDAASANRLDIVQWLHANRREGCSTTAINSAVYNNRMELVRWLLENRSERCALPAINGAASNGDLQMMEWLYTNQSERCSERTMINVASTGRLEIVQWVHERYLAGEYGSVIAEAIAHGRLRVLEWLVETTSVEWDPNYLQIAVYRSQVSSAKWLHANFGHLEDFKLPNLQLTGRSLKGSMLEWLAIHFPDEEVVMNEIQGRLSLCLQTVENPNRRLSSLDTDFEP